MSYEQLAQSVDGLHTQVTALTQGIQDALKRTADLAKVNNSYPFTFVPGQVQYDVVVISGDPKMTTAGMGLWIEGAIEYAFTVDSLTKFTLQSTENYSATTQMRLLGNKRFDDLVQNFGDLETVISGQYEVEKSERITDYYQYLSKLELEATVPYVAGMSIIRPTQTVTYLGVRYRPLAVTLPFTTVNWTSDSPKFLNAEDVTLRQDLAGLEGSKLSEYKGRTVFDRLADVVCILDAPYNAKPDGTPQEEAFDKFHNDLATNGWTGWYGPYPLNAGKHRFKRTIGVQAFKPFTVYGNSNLITLENIDPIYTPGAGQKGLANEPHLFDLRGNSAAKIPHPTVTFRDFAIDYSNQRFKGGASEVTPTLTDIDPLSTGMKLFYSEYGRVVIENITASEVYGEFVQLNRSPYSIIRDNIAYNVSAGNIGRNDSTGAFALVLRGSTTGTIITGNKAINKRVYQTDTVRGYTDRTSKNTPCGYMGVALEYDNSVGDPAVDYELWANAGKPSTESLLGVVSGNTMYGYYMGYKAETKVAFSMSNNLALCCWMPYVVSTRCRGVLRDNFADRGYLDDLIQPMGGYRYVQGMYSHLSYTTDEQDTSDVVFDGNMCTVRSIPVFSTNCNNSKFLNQMTRMFGSVPLISASANRVLTGLEFTGSVTIESQTASYLTNITDFIDAKIDLRVVNKTEYGYSLRLNAYYAAKGTYRPSVKLVGVGIVGINFYNSTPNPFLGDFTLNDPTLTFSTANYEYNRFYAANDSIGGDARMTVRMHSAAVPLGYPVQAYGGGGKVEADFFISDGGENKVVAAVRVGGSYGYSSPALRVRKHTDPYNTPLVSHFTRFSKSLRIDEAFGNGPIMSGNTSMGPLYLPPFYEATQISATGSTEPNSLANLRKCTVGDGDAYYVQGMRVPYLRPSQNGKEGILCTVSGWLADAWVANAVVSINTYRQVKATARVYRCTVAGTVGTVEPSHVVGTANDGTVTWQYIGPMAQFAEYGATGPNL